MSLNTESCGIKASCLEACPIEGTDVRIPHLEEPTSGPGISKVQYLYLWCTFAQLNLIREMIDHFSANIVSIGSDDVVKSSGSTVSFDRSVHSCKFDITTRLVL